MFPELKDGYAPFCKHIFIPNFTDGKLYYSLITDDTNKLIESEYKARTEYELPVLRRFIRKENINPTIAKYIDIILYSKEQIKYEDQKLVESGRIEKSNFVDGNFILLLN